MVNSLKKHVGVIWNKKYAIATGIVFVVLLISYITYRLKKTVKSAPEELIDGLSKSFRRNNDGSIEIVNDNLELVSEGYSKLFLKSTLEQLEKLGFSLKDKGGEKLVEIIKSIEKITENNKEITKFNTSKDGVELAKINSAKWDKMISDINGYFEGKKYERLENLINELLPYASFLGVRRDEYANLENAKHAYDKSKGWLGGYDNELFTKLKNEVERMIVNGYNVTLNDGILTVKKDKESRTYDYSNAKDLLS